MGAKEVLIEHAMPFATWEGILENELFPSIKWIDRLYVLLLV